MSLIQIKSLSKSYRNSKMETKAVNGVNLSIGQGEFVVITGASGSGKSSLLKCIGLLDQNIEGSVEIDGEAVPFGSSAKMDSMRKRMFGYVFQSEHLIERWNVFDNVMMPFRYRKLKDAKQRVESAILSVGLSKRKQHQIQELSGGQKQRVAIARAVAYSPKILLADEPTGKLDDKNTNEICALLQNLTKQGTTVIMVTHDLRLTSYASSHYEMRDGHLTEVTERTAQVNDTPIRDLAAQ